jgi:hypothetical protein
MSGARQVTHTIRTDDDKHFVDISVKGDSVKKLTATDSHPFWSQSRKKWVEAGALRVGELLRTSAGTYVQITAIRSYEDSKRTYDLTVDGLHTYYVEVGDSDVLVHNTTPIPPVPAGVIYLRTDVLTGEEYVGQAESWSRYLSRQREHARDHPHASFKFEVLGRANPGVDLDVLEESWMRAGGGKKSVPGSVLQNKRVQMSDKRYKAAGGTVC